MASRAPLAEFRSSLWTRDEFARRFALAREDQPKAPERPHILRFLAEAEVFAEPIKRLRRTIAVPTTKRPRTIMVLPGFMTHPVRMKYMAEHLERAGHITKRWGLGFNLGPSEETFEQLEQRLLTIHDAAGEPVVLLGWSLGGVFARELSKRHPETVAKVISMGSPFSGDPRANNVWRIYQFVAGHSVDAPPVAQDISAKPPVETVALWSPRDGMIAPRSAAGLPGERDRAIALRCTHIGFSYSPEAIRTVLAELERG